MDTIELTSEFLRIDAEAPGLHKRLLAGLHSVLDRYGDPVVTRYERTGEARSPYRDHDLVVHMRPGATEDGRRVEGRLSWPLHITNSGATQPAGLRTRPSVDLTVTSRDGGESTRFVGDLLDVEVAAAPGPQWYEVGGTGVEPTSAGREARRLLRRIAERAAFGEIATDAAQEATAESA